MATYTHERQERYSSLVLAKLRKDLKLKDGIVFNNDYEGNPTADGENPVRYGSHAGDYEPATGLALSSGATTYKPLLSYDKAVNEIIDAMKRFCSDNLVADRLDSAAYALALRLDTEGNYPARWGRREILRQSPKITRIPRWLTSAPIYQAHIPNDARRYALSHRTFSLYS